MKTFFIKKAKGAKPVVGASVLTKKPETGSYVSFNVPTDVKVLCTRTGGFDVVDLRGNMPLESNAVTISFETVGGGSLEYTNMNIFISQPPYDQIQTVDQLLEMTNKRLAGTLHFVLENGEIYLTKNGMSTEMAGIEIGPDVF
jgi:hypothetical protein